MNKILEEKLKTLPRSPGVYFHKDKAGEIIYVGKAAVLKNRVRQYFQSRISMDNKTLALVSEIEDTDWVEVDSEVDALFLESEMVKRYMPRYNVLLRDDKSQSYVRIDMKSEWPAVTFTRNPADDGAEYYGPFYNGFALKRALRYLRRVFPYFVRHPKPEDSKLNEAIGITPKMSDGSEVYKQNLRKLISYIKGNRVQIVRELEKSMKLAAERQEFENAARIRNKLRSMQELQRRVMFGDREFLDISKDSALKHLTELLQLKKPPMRIEGYDISHHGGQSVVASMVVFTNGVSNRGEYRKFKMQKQQNDDYQNMYDTLYRRLSEKNIKAWGKPDLVLIDGGKGQLKSAIAAIEKRQIYIPIVSISKREEELIVHRTDSQVDPTYLAGLVKNPIPGIVVETSGDFYVVNLHPGQVNAGSHSKNLRGSSVYSTYNDVVKLFQRIRDESHRFAVSYHSVLQRKKQTTSILDGIPGVGPATRRKLMNKFGSVRGIGRASAAELASVVGAKKSEEIRKFLPQEDHSNE